MDVFDLSELQATYILDLQLRRLTKFSRHRARDREGRAGAPDRGAARPSSATRSCCCARCRTSSPRWPRPTARRGARCCWSPPVRRVQLRGGALPLEVDRRPLLGAAVLDRPAGADASTAEPLPREGGRQQARRHRRRGPHDRSRRGRAGHEPRPDDPALGAGAARAPDDRRRPVPRRRRPARRVPRRPAARASEPLDPGLGLARDSPGLALGTAQGVVKRVTHRLPRAGTTGS